MIQNGKTRSIQIIEQSFLKFDEHVDEPQTIPNLIDTFSSIHSNNQKDVNFDTISYDARMLEGGDEEAVNLLLSSEKEDLKIESPNKTSCFSYKFQSLVQLCFQITIVADLLTNMLMTR